MGLNKFIWDIVIDLSPFTVISSEPNNNSESDRLQDESGSEQKPTITE